MTRKHAHRADNAPASRRYVRSVVQRARDDILSAIVHAPETPEPVGHMFMVTTADEAHTWPPERGTSYVEWRAAGGEFPPQIEADRVQARLERYAGPIGKES